MSRTTSIALSIIATILLMLFLHHEIIVAEVESLVMEEMGLAHGPGVGAWSAAQDGVQVSLRIVGIREIQFSSGDFIFGPFGTRFIGPAFCKYPSPGTKPHLLVQAQARNVSDHAVYLIGDKTRSGIEGPAFLRICLKHDDQISAPLNLHPLPFERQQSDEVKPGQDRLFLEYIPYDDLASAPGGDILGMVSIVHDKPAHGSHVPPDSVAYSEPVPIPAHLFRHYFNIIW